MVTKTNLAIRNKYIDLDLEDCVLPRYISKRFFQAIEHNNLPPMVFTGAVWEPKTIVTNALAKKFNAQLLALDFNQEVRSKSSNRGDQTLKSLETVTKDFADAGERKFFIIEDLKNFPRKRYQELFNFISNETFHHFIFFSVEKSFSQYVKHFPQISFEFKINHTPEEEEAYWQQCQTLLMNHNKSMNITELKMIIKSTYFFWLSLFGREALQSLRKELEFLPLNPVKQLPKITSHTHKPIRLYPPIR